MATFIISLGQRCCISAPDSHRHRSPIRAHRHIGSVSKKLPYDCLGYDLGVIIQSIVRYVSINISEFEVWYECCTAYVRLSVNYIVCLSKINPNEYDDVLKISRNFILHLLSYRINCLSYWLISWLMAVKC
jgi:hypothetical protein